MPIKPYNLPPKPCAKCGKLMSRPRFSNGELEAPTLFTRRKFCSRTCAGWRPNVKKNALLKRARKHLKNFCESCGASKRLQAHHIDQNHLNSSAENIQTLCKHCHDFWHGNALILGRYPAGRMPRIVPTELKDSATRSSRKSRSRSSGSSEKLRKAKTDD